MNQSQIFTPKLKFLLAAIGIVALSRLLPHNFNFSPVGAIALFSGAYITNKKWAYIFPLITLFISDLLLQAVNGTGFYRDMIFVYGAFAILVTLGFFLRDRDQPQNILVTSLVGSVIFFVITNFGTWLMYDDMYAKTGTGLLNCYIAGIPFFRGTVMGDLCYNVLLFGSFALARWRFPILAKN